MEPIKSLPKSASLLLAVTLAIAAGTVSAPEAQAGRAPARVKPASKVCYYGSGIFNLGNCRGGQRCVQGVNEEDYWEDDSACDQTSPGGGGMRQV